MICPPEFSPRLLTRYEVMVLAGLYFPYLEVEHAAMVAFRESGFNTGEWNNNRPVEDSRGLMQINVLAWPGPGAYNLWDPQINLYWAGWIFNRAGWHPWYTAQPPYLPWL